MKIDIYSTWGDNHYVGLNGIELFDNNGKSVIINNAVTQVRADPSDINVLAEYYKDPRIC